MITGAIILFIGIVIGYFLGLWNEIKFWGFNKEISNEVKKGVSNLFSRKVKIVDLSEVDLGENE